MIIRIRYILLVAFLAPILAQNNWQDEVNCGKQYVPEMNTMIVGGEKAEDYEYPWQAAFYRGGRRICGASLITPEWIITAAHCVDIIFEPELFEFMVGSNTLLEEEFPQDTAQRRTASEVYVHPDYDDSTFDNDIALFKMETKFDTWSNYKVNTVCLPRKSDEDRFPAGQDAVVTGWGALEQGGASPTDLYEVTVPIYDQHECNMSYSGSITDNMICAGIPEGGIDSCQGDSGGPMVSYKNGTSDQYDLIGIVSWGRGCAQEGYPGVYTRVTEFEDWILPIFNDGKPTTKDGICAANEFLCRGGECIQDRFRCSGSGQCYHDTDEEFCDGTLKLFDVFYYSRIVPDDIELTHENQMSKEECANTCMEIKCRAFDVTPEDGGTFKCEFAMQGYDVVDEPNDFNRTFNHFVLIIQEPGMEVQQAAGVIASPSYFGDVEPGNQRYEWTINVPFAGKDTLIFNILSVTGNSTCENSESDYALLSITGGNSVEKTSYCLNEDAMGAEFMVKGSEAVVELMTSDAAMFEFLLEYESIYDCDRSVTMGPGYIVSPNYPEEYPNSVSCDTHFMAPEGEVVYFLFESMNIESHPTCVWDYVALYDGPNDEAPLIGRYCGGTMPTKTFQSTGREMFVRFYSDGSVTSMGFKADYSFDIARNPTDDPDKAIISSLESELSGYKFGIAAAVIMAALLIMVLAASLYTVNKRDAKNAAKLADIEAAEESKPGYHTIEDDDEVDHGYYPITKDNEQGTQASKDGIIAETGHVVKANGDVNSNVNNAAGDGGIVNNAFADDEGLAEEAAAAVAAVDDAVVEKDDNPGYSTIVVAADVTPQPKEDAEEAFPAPPVESPPVPPPEIEVDAPTDSNEESSAM